MKTANELALEHFVELTRLLREVDSGIIRQALHHPHDDSFIHQMFVKKFVQAMTEFSHSKDAEIQRLTAEVNKLKDAVKDSWMNHAHETCYHCEARFHFVEQKGKFAEIICDHEPECIVWQLK